MSEGNQNSLFPDSTEFLVPLTVAVIKNKQIWMSSVGLPDPAEIPQLSFMFHMVMAGLVVNSLLLLVNGDMRCHPGDSG